MNNVKKRTPSNPNPRKQKQACYFIRSLSRISLAPAPFHKRHAAIRRAAYASMARSARPGRAWSRALLSRLLHRRARPVPARLRPHRGQEDGLRRLLPGGESMDFGELLEQTIDYVTSLKAQVKLMQEIAEYVEDGRTEGN